MLLATVAIACLGNYIFRAAIVVRLLLFIRLALTPRQYILGGGVRANPINNK